MRERLELPRLSIAERDRRWAETRAEMRKRGLDCLVLWGWPAMWDFCTANARYLCPIGGNAENNTLIFPLEGEPTSFVFMPTFVEYWKRAQDWVPDVRPRQGPWANTVVARLKELGLDGATIGMDGLAGPLDPDGWLPHSIYDGMTSAMTAARFVNIGDMMELLRAVKSPEELGMLETAAALGDRMLQTCRDVARPGVRESKVYAGMMEAMLAEGGEEPTLFLWACDQFPLPHPFRLPTTRRMEARDLITCEIHPKIGGYFTHVERTFCLGDPDPNTMRIHDGCLAAFREGMKMFGPGRSIAAAMGEVKARHRRRPASESARRASTVTASPHSNIPAIASTRSRRTRRPLRPSATVFAREWCSPSTSTSSIRVGETARPAPFSPRPSSSRQRARARCTGSRKSSSASIRASDS